MSKQTNTVLFSRVEFKIILQEPRTTKMANSDLNSSTNQNKSLPNPFQHFSNQPEQSTSDNSASNQIGLHGYRSTFNISAQKQSYQQRRNQTINQRPNNFNRNSQTKDRQPNRNHNVNASQEKTFGKESTNWCDLCERGLKYPNQLEKHVDEHEKCWFENCSFEGHTKLLQRHIEVQHQSGMFKKIGKIETDEDIEKWREERRKRYPTAANIETRRRAQEERMKRGERLQEPNNRFGKMSDRESAQCRNFSNKQNTPFKQSAEKKKRNRRPRNKDKNRNVSKAPGDNETGKNESDKTETKADTAPNKTPANSNPLTALLGLYGSDSEESEGDVTMTDEATKKVENNIDQSTIDLNTDSNLAENPHLKRSADDNDNDSKSDTPAKQFKSEIPEKLNQTENESDDEPPEQEPIQHNITNNEMDESSSGMKEIIPGRAEVVKPLKAAPAKKSIFDRTRKIRNQNTLLEKLLQKEIRHERNVLLQCVRFVMDNNYFGIGQENAEN